MKKSKSSKERTTRAKLELKATTIARLDPTEVVAVAGGSGNNKGGAYL